MTFKEKLTSFKTLSASEICQLEALFEQAHCTELPAVFQQIPIVQAMHMENIHILTQSSLDADDTLLSCIIFKLDDERSDVYIYILCIDSSHQGQGHGSYALERFAHVMAHRCVRSIRLKVDKDNHRMKALALKGGYFDCEKGHPSLIFYKKWL